MLINQLQEEKVELKTRVSELSFELEEMRANQTERMETSFASPVRMSLGAAFAVLNIEQDDIGQGNISFDTNSSLEDIFRDNQRVRCMHESCKWH
jgi:hypothetical protein